MEHLDMPRDPWYKNEETDKIWWEDTDYIGEFIFSFDKQHEYNLFQDYPYKLTKEEKALFDQENPHWRDFFTDRQS